MDKKSQFLSEHNKICLIRTMYARHKNDGGTFTIATFQEQIPVLMRQWQIVPQLDTYESIIHDPESELEAINNDFVRTYWPMFSVGDNYKTVRKLETPADYHNLDTCSAPDIVVTNSVYRYDNTIPLYQRLPDRHYDRDLDGSGLHGRALEQNVSSCGDMARLYEYTERPYKKVDDGDVEYYGQEVDDSSSELTAAIWRTS